MVKDGATTGRVGLMIDDTECVALSSVAILRPKHEYMSEYLMYVMMSKFVQEQISVHQQQLLKQYSSQHL